MELLKKYFNQYSIDLAGYVGASLIGAGLGLAICKLI